MFFKSTKEVPAFVAGDATYLRELLHPKNDHFESNYSLIHAALEIGKRSYSHILKQQSELYYVLEGKGRLHIETESKVLKVGDLALVKAGEKQYIVNVGTTVLRFLCIVSPPWSADDEVILD